MSERSNNDITEKTRQEVPAEKEPSTEEINKMNLAQLKELTETLKSQGKELRMGCWINGCYIGPWDEKTLSGDACPVCGEVNAVSFFIHRRENKSSPSEEKEK